MTIILYIVIALVLLAVWMRIGLIIVIPWLQREVPGSTIDVGTYMMAVMWPIIVVFFMFLPWACKPLTPKKYR